MDVMDRTIQLAFLQTIWQFTGTLAVTKINKSTFQAKENAVMTLFYINVIRITLLMIMKKNEDQLLPLAFMDKMAAIKERVISYSFIFFRIRLEFRIS